MAQEPSPPAPAAEPARPTDAGWQWMTALPVPALCMDVAGNAVACNPAWSRFMGSVLAGQDVMGLFHPEDRMAWMTQLMACVHAVPLPHTGAATDESAALRLLPPGGAVAWCSIALQRHQEWVCMVAHDVTGYHRREAQLRAASRGAFSLLNGIPAMLYRGRNDRNWSMEMVSEGCHMLTGYSPQDIELEGRLHFNQLIVPPDVDYVWDGVQEALLRRRPYRLWYAITCADGRIKQVFEIGQGIYSHSNEVLGVEGMITERFEPPA